MKAEVESLFHELADLSPQARTQYFADHAVDDDTRRQVEALLAFDADDNTFLAGEISEAAQRALPKLEAPGWRCGPYRLLDVIGRGGMGTVYLAERADGEVIQRLAVKMLPPGTGDAHRERFLLERQILAHLTHPNIARMLDVGHLENGQPFLAMEYVDGKPIDMFAAELPLRQKISLFLKVCAAVAYLHRNLVVHRDLKPSNVLVTPDGEPKLLDFGIAKILDVATDSTMTNMRVLTPDYASPEQVTGGTVSTAIDIYALGAVLYRMLTGKPAHQFDERSPEAIAHVVTTRESTRPSKWAPELKGDLDFILMKALRKDPQQRYATVEQFAEDLEAFLQSRPVRARSGDAWYRTRRFLRRYWIPASAAALVIASLSVGLYLANRERRIAQRRFTDVRELANKLFDIDNVVLELPGSAKARQLIVDTSLEYLQRLKNDVQGDPGLALEVASAYLSVAEVEGVTTGPNLGEVDHAERDLKIAGDLIQSVLRIQPRNRTALLRAATIAADQMIIAWEQSRNDEALALARKSADWLDKFNANENDKAEVPAILLTYSWVAHQYMLGQQFEDALRLCRRGGELANLFGRPLDRFLFLDTTSLALRYQGHLDEALDTAREAVRIVEPRYAENGYSQAMNLTLALVREGWILGEDNGVSLGRSDEAVSALERAFKIADDFVHKDPKDEASRSRLYLAGGPMADILARSNPQRALAVYDHTFRDMAEVNSKFLQLREINLLAGASSVLQQLGHGVEAKQRLDRAFASLKELNLYPADKIDVGSEAERTIAAQADLDAARGNIKGGIETYQNLLDRMTAAGAKPMMILPEAVDVSHIYQMMADLQRRNKRPDLGAEWETRRLDLWQHWDHQLPNNAFVRGQIAAVRPY